MSPVNVYTSLAETAPANQKTVKLAATAETTLNLERVNLTASNYNKIIIICGPTATGKTKFGINIARKFNGEIVSADSRQVYVGKNIVYGKDLPPNIKYQISNIKWRIKFLPYYEVQGVKIWLYDVVHPGEEFSVALWKECADLVISDILSRKKLPIIVGGTGLYLKSLTQSLSQITIPPHPRLRKKLQNKSAEHLFNYLKSVSPTRAADLNTSDRRNPRRLLRAIEIAAFKSGSSPSLYQRGGSGVSYLSIGLTAPRGYLYQQVDFRVEERIRSGAASEDRLLASNPQHWKNMEHAIVRRQLTWFKKQSHAHWFDISQHGWKEEAVKIISNWYNA